MPFFGTGGASGYPPVTSTAGAVQVGFSGGDALGSDAVNIQSNRNATNKVASGSNSTAIGKSSRATQPGAIAIGHGALATGWPSIHIGGWDDAGGSASGGGSLAFHQSSCSGQWAQAVGVSCDASGSGAFACGYLGTASGVGSFSNGNAPASLRAMASFPAFFSVYWGGQTTNNTPTILNLDATATNRFTIGANTAIMADLFIIARRSDTVGKWFSSRRTVAIRRNNANGTAIIGSVQTIGADQTEGSPTWSVAITADDTNEALQVEVTGATGETVQWRVMAMCRVV